MTRTYTKKRRAEQEGETRQRIVEAAVDLHSTVGPKRTTISMLAERAGVQRHTVYAHFPDTRSLLMACSGLAEERDAMPDAEAWRSVTDRAERLRAGLSTLYGWFARNASLVACVLRDAEDDALLREIVEAGYGPRFRSFHEVLGEGLSGRQRTILQLALSFYTWRSLTRDSGLNTDAAVETMVQAIAAA